mgnify:FL=1
MKYYQISFPGEFGQHVDEIWSEKQILKAYYPYWCGMMVQNIASPDLNPVTCIDDWCVTHWAVEVPKPNWITEAADLMSDKGYEIGTLEEAEEFARKRNA